MRMNLGTTSCSRGGCNNRMLSGRSPVASAGICCPSAYIHPPSSTPTHPPPLQPSAGVADWFTAVLSRQMAAVGWPWGTSRGLSSRELILPRTPKGANPGSWHIQWSTQCTRRMGRIGHWSADCGICSVWKDSQPPRYETQMHRVFVKKKKKSFPNKTDLKSKILIILSIETERIFIQYQSKVTQMGKCVRTLDWFCSSSTFCNTLLFGEWTA